MKIDGFRYSCNADGTYTLYDVPVFYECDRDGEKYDEAWIRYAYDALFEAEITKGHRPPITFGHRRASNPEPAGAGWWAARRVGKFAGKTALFANMTLNQDGFDAIKSKRYPYRSVEAMRPSAEDRDENTLPIESLSLLDNAPYLALPMTFLGDEVGSEDAPIGASVTATFSRARGSLSPVVAFASVGARCLILCEAPMADDEDEIPTTPEATEEGVGRAVALLRELMATPVPLQDGKIVATLLREKLSELESIDDDASRDVGKSPPSDDPVQPDLSQDEPRDGKDPMNMSAVKEHAMSHLFETRIAALESERKQDAVVRKVCKRLEGHAFASDPEAACREVIAKFPDKWEEALNFAADLWEKNSPKARSGAGGFDADAPDYPADVAALGLTDPNESEVALRAHAAFSATPAAALGKTNFASYYRANKSRFMA